MNGNHNRRTSLRAHIREVLHNEHSPWYFFVNDTIAALIVISVVLLILETVPSIGGQYRVFFTTAEMFVLSFFFVEYLLRLWTAERPARYAVSFFGVIDA